MKAIAVHTVTAGAKETYAPGDTIDTKDKGCSLKDADVKELLDSGAARPFVAASATADDAPVGEDAGGEGGQAPQA